MTLPLPLGRLGRVLVPGLFLLLAFHCHAAPKPRLLLGPMVGHVTDHDARIWVKATQGARVSIQWGETEDLERFHRVDGGRLLETNAFAGSVTLTGLQPAHRYFYSVTLDGKPATLAPYPSFVTAAAPGVLEHLRFAFVSCSGYQPHDPAAGWADLGMRTNIDLILMLGDNHYGNSADLLKQRAAYLGQRRSLGFREATSRIPTYGIWDDHDFGDNDSDGTLIGKEGALQAFHEHWANPSFGEPGNPGVYFKFSRGGIDFFCLDDRYYRMPNKTPDGPSKTMLGSRQLAWLKQSLLDSKAPVKILAAGGEWQSNGTPDSWTSFARERDEIFSWIRDHHIEGVVLISGDRHFTGAYQVQKRFIEVTSGPIGGGMAETKNLPEMFLNHGKGRFYCIFDVDATRPVPALTLEMYQIGVGLIERRTFTWDEVNGRTSIPLLGTPAPKPIAKP